jgi:transcriptional regulator with XRE-family HTH domain
VTLPVFFTLISSVDWHGLTRGQLDGSRLFFAQLGADFQHDGIWKDLHKKTTCGYTLCMTQENLTQYLRRRLSEMVGQHNRIAKEAGIPQTSVSRIYAGTTTNPTVKNIELLLNWFRQHDAKKPKRKSKSATTWKVRKMTETTRAQAQRLNPLVGINSKDTTSQVTKFLREVGHSSISLDMMPILAELAAAALEFEQKS